MEPAVGWCAHPCANPCAQQVLEKMHQQAAVTDEPAAVRARSKEVSLLKKIVGKCVPADAHATAVHAPHYWGCMT